MALPDNQLLWLDHLIYTEYCGEGLTVEKIIHDMTYDLDNGNSITGIDYMTDDDWRSLISMIESQPELLSYTVTDYVDDDSGMRAACFVDDVNNPTDVNVIFRGTSGDTEWHDNGEGAYLTSTTQQIAAAEYINNLPESYGNNITVPGHSKGGNKAQYVTIVTDRIGRCVSYDAQGFSNEFIETNSDAIEANSYKITAYCAAADPVSPLLNQITDVTYIWTEDQGALYLGFIWIPSLFKNHVPFYLLDEDGNLNPERQQNWWMEQFHEFNNELIDTLPDSKKSYVIDGLLALFEEGENSEGSGQVAYAITSAIGNVNNYAFDYVLDDENGFWSKVAVGLIGILTLPFTTRADAIIWFIDLINGEPSADEYINNELSSFRDEYSLFTSTFASNMYALIREFKERLESMDNSSDSVIVDTSTKDASYTSSYFRVDTNSLRECAERLTKVVQRVRNLNADMHSLYKEKEWIDLGNILQTEPVTKYCGDINACIDWLNETADEFEAAERSIINAAIS